MSLNNFKMDTNINIKVEMATGPVHWAKPIQSRFGSRSLEIGAGMEFQILSRVHIWFWLTRPVSQPQNITS